MWFVLFSPWTKSLLNFWIGMTFFSGSLALASLLIAKGKTAPIGLDLIMDFVGPETFTTSWELLKKGGTMLLCGILTSRETNLNIQFTYLRHLSIKGLNLGTLDELKELLDLVAEGTLKPYIGERFPLEEAAEAQKMMEENRQIGKIILKP